VSKRPPLPFSLPEKPKNRPATSQNSKTQQQQQDASSGVVKNPLLLTSVVVAADWTRDDADDEEQNSSCCSCSCYSSSSFLRSTAAAARPELFALALAHSAAFWGLFMISKSSCGEMNSGETGFWSPRAVTTAAALTYELAALATAAKLLLALSSSSSSSSRKAKSLVEKIAASLAGAMFSVQWGAFSYLFWAALAE
jgi:hypothetical protein